MESASSSSSSPVEISEDYLGSIGEMVRNDLAVANITYSRLHTHTIDLEARVEDMQARIKHLEQDLASKVDQIAVYAVYTRDLLQYVAKLEAGAGADLLPPPEESAKPENTGELDRLEAQNAVFQVCIAELERDLACKTEEAAAGSRKIVELTAQLQHAFAQNEENNASNSRRINELVAHSERVFEETVEKVIMEAQANADKILHSVKLGLEGLMREMGNVTADLHHCTEMGNGEIAALHEALASVASEKDELKRHFMMHTFQMGDQLSLFGLSLMEFTKELR
jgi:hypothetical protein